MEMKILLVEDDVEISDMLKNFLHTENFEVIPAYDGEEAIEKFFADSYSLVLLDLMIPKRNGMEVMKVIRETSIVPIIILSAKESDTDKALGLGLGADDYITKPFSVTEVLARIKANIRRSTQYVSTANSFVSNLSATANSMIAANTVAGGSRLADGYMGENIIKKGCLAMNTDSYSLEKSGKAIELTAKEFEILKLLMKNPKKVYTKEQIYSQIWDDAYLGDENAVNVHISRLRSKIEDNPRDPKYIVTVWGIGYKLGDI